MNLERLLKTLIICSIAFDLLGVIVDSLFPQLLPRILQDYKSAETNDMSDYQAFLFIGLFIFLIISIVGLWRIKAWGRSLFTIQAILYNFVAPIINEPEVISSVASVFNDLSLMCDGGILVLIWYSDLNKTFLFKNSGA